MSNMNFRIHPLQQHYEHVKQKGIQPKHSGVSFKDVFSNVQDIKVSKHAQQRLIERNIEINDQQWKVVKEKMSEAKAKGVTDSLVLMNDAALLVSTKNNTIVTAMNREEANSKIFTNINGTILIDD